MTDSQPANQLYASSKFRVSADVELIACVRARPVLYNPTHSRYMDSTLKMTLWGKIAKQLNANPLACKARWNNIRDNYRKSLRRRHWSGHTRYKYSNLLSFMDQYYKTKVNFGDEKIPSIKPRPVEDQEEDNSEDSVEAQETTDNDNDDENKASETEATEVDVSNIKQDHSDVEAVEEQNESMVDYEFFEKTPTSISGARFSTSEAVDAFLAALAPPLKTLNPYHLSLAKAEIFATVHKYELKAIVESERSKDVNPLK